MITEWLAAARAMSSPNKATVRLPAIASVPDGVTHSANSGVAHSARTPVTCS